MSEQRFNDDDQDIRGDVWSDGEDLADDAILEGLEGLEDVKPQRDVVPKGRGTDHVLSRLEKTDPEAARVVRSMQQKMSQNINEWNDLRAEVLNLREQMLSGRTSEEGEKSSPSEKTLPEGVTPEHLQLFKNMADYLDYVPRSELQNKEVEESATSYVQDDLKKAVEEFGEDFGTIAEDGSVVLNPAIRDRLNARMQTLSDPKKGVTPRDLFLLEFGGRAKRPSAQTSSESPRARTNGSVVRRSTGGGGRVRIYDPKRGDSRDDVFERAAALAKRELSR